MSAVAVSFDGVVKAFGPVRVLHGVSFDLAPFSPSRPTTRPKRAAS